MRPQNFNGKFKRVILITVYWTFIKNYDVLFFN